MKIKQSSSESTRLLSEVLGSVVQDFQVLKYCGTRSEIQYVEVVNLKV